MTGLFTLTDFQNREMIYNTSLGNSSFSYQRSLSVPLFKYTETRWADMFFETGQMRLGTIWDFRRSELGDELGDDIEGIRSYHFRKNGVPVVAGAVAKDSFVFCTSHDCDSNRFKNESYAAVYSINDIQFFIEIAKVLNSISTLKGSCVNQVIYAEESEVLEYVKEEFSFDDYKAGTQADIFPPVGLVKPPRLSHQNEVRAIFEPAESVNADQYTRFEDGASVSQLMEQKNLKSRLCPIDICVPNARKFATRIR